MTKTKKCWKCGKRATWARTSMFSGNVYFCDKHAKEHPYWKCEGIEAWWEKIKDE